MKTSTCITLTNTDLKDLTKDQLIELCIYSDALAKEKGRKPKGPNRKDQFIKLIKLGPITIDDIATKLRISNKNVSSLKCYAVKDGYAIGKNSKNELVLE